MTDELDEITDEDVARTKRELKFTLAELHNMSIPGGYASSREPVKDEYETKHRWLTSE